GKEVQVLLLALPVALLLLLGHIPVGRLLRYGAPIRLLINRTSFFALATWRFLLTYTQGKLRVSCSRLDSHSSSFPHGSLLVVPRLAPYVTPIHRESHRILLRQCRQFLWCNHSLLDRSPIDCKSFLEIPQARIP